VLQAGAGDARALTDEEIFRDFHFELAGPGSRNLALGGAAIVIADDATSARANPAGLRYIAGPQLFLELRATDDDPGSLASATGSLAVDPITGDRDLPFLGVRSASESDRVVLPGYLAFARPFELGGGRRLSAAFSRHVVLSQERRLPAGGEGTEARFAFDTFPNTVNGGTVEAYSVATPVTGSSDTTIVYWNGAAALDVSPDFSVGLTVTYAALDLEAGTLTQVIDPQEIFLEPGHPRLPATPSSDLYETRIDDSDTDVTWAVGIHWHPDTVFSGGASPWQFAAAFRRGTSFSVTESTVLNQVPSSAFDTMLAVPDSYGLGVSYRPEPRWLLAVEYERIEFSDMLRGFRSGVNFLTSGQVANGAFGVAAGVPIEYTVDDGSVVRAGVEYTPRLARGRGTRLALRAGYYRTPDSRIRMSRFNSTDPAVNALYLEAFGGGEAEDHYTGGVGFSFGRSSFDIAAETSDPGTRIVGAWIVSWGGPP
jgi:long-subunit fatty acid transport protein